MEKFYFEGSDSKYWNPDDYVIEDPEYGVPGVILFRPISNHHWYRSDDMIDYCEHEMRYHQMRNTIKFLDTPLYPYVGYMNAISGEKYNIDPKARLAQEFWYAVRTKRTANDKKNWELYAESNAKKLGFESVKQAKLNIIPVIPQELVALIKYLNIFNDDNTIWQLRPAIYTFWS